MRWLHFFIALAVFAADQAAKSAIESALPLHDSWPVIPGLFRLTHVKNRGAAFGIFADSTSPMKIEVLILLSIVALVVVLALLWRHQPNARRTGLGLALILGGAVGNLFDRLVHGSVVDFLDFSLGGFHWPAFNIADSAIVIGAGLLVLDMLLTRSPSMERGKP
jgi:signal peptidase II